MRVIVVSIAICLCMAVAVAASNLVVTAVSGISPLGPGTIGVFAVNGVATPAYSWVVGSTVTFDTTALAGHHALGIWASGASGYSTDGGQSAGTSYTVTSGQIGNVTFTAPGAYVYGCIYQGHTFMGNAINITGTAPTTSSSSTGPVGAASASSSVSLILLAIAAIVAMLAIRV